MPETRYTAEEIALWNLLTMHQNEEYHTAKGLAFTYEIRGGEMFIDRRGKSVTRATVNVAYRRAMELGEELKGPKKLSVFGASYIYPVFVALGVVTPASKSLR